MLQAAYSILPLRQAPKHAAQAQVSRSFASGSGSSLVLKREFNVEAGVGTPQVAYKETLTRAADGEGRYIKQTGGCGQYGHATIRLLPRKPGEGYEFVNSIVGGTIPREFIKPIDEGIKEALTTGALAGYPVDDVGVELYDGSYHDVDSNEMAFKIAGSMAFKDAAKKAAPVIHLHSSRALRGV